MKIEECVNEHGYSYINPKDIIKKVEEIKQKKQRKDN
jgi:hypothetical protein